MKIILATPIYPPEIGGPATYVKELCERLSEKHKLTVVAYTDVRESFANTRLLSVSKRRPLPIRLFKFFIATLRESKHSDLIYVQNAMAAGLPVALVSLLRGIPFVLKFVGDEAWERATQQKITTKRLEEFLDKPDGTLKIKLMMKVQGFVLRRATIVTTPSAYLREEIVKAYGIKQGRAVVNYNAAEETEKIPLEITRKKHTIATTARLTAWKGIDGIIRVVSLLVPKIPDIHLKVAGDGPEMENLQKLVKDLGVAEHVELMGKISRAETWRLRKESEIYVLNSTYEGLPHTVLTSFAADIPTIATNIAGTNEAIYHEQTGLLVTPGNDAELASAIERLFNDTNLQNTLIENGRKLLKEKFSWEAHLEVLDGFFQSVVAKPRNQS